MKAKMKKVYILSHHKFELELLGRLQKYGKLHISNVKDTVEGEDISQVFARESEFSSSYDPRLSQVHHLIQYLESFIDKPSDPIENFVTIKHLSDVPKPKWDEYVNKGLNNLDKIAGEIHKIEIKIDKNKNKHTKLFDLKDNYKHLLDVDLDISKFEDTGHVNFIVGRIKRVDLNNLNKLSHKLHIDILSEGKSNVTVLVALLKNDDDSNQLLLNNNFEIINLPDPCGFEGTPKQIIKQIDSELVLLDDDHTLYVSLLKIIYDKWILYLKSAYDHLSLIYQQKEKAKLAVSSHNTFLIRAWAKVEYIPEIKQILKEATNDNYEIIVKDPKSSDRAPILLENHPLLKPFETVTNAFGLPAYNNIDPTPFLAPFFFIFTGICLTDAVYGILLAVLSFYMSTRYKDMKNFFTLLMYVGISTAVIGAVIGSWAGFADFTVFGIQFPLFNAMANPIQFLVVALILGFVQSIFGILVSMYHNIKTSNYSAAILDDFVWLGLIFSILGYGLSMVGIIDNAMLDVMSYLCLGFVALIILFAGRSQKNILNRIMSGLARLYDLIGFSSDILSYARLLALGMATGVIGMILNKVAAMAYYIPVLVIDLPIIGNISIIGFVIATFIFVGGHLFNLGISLMSAYIHSSRLQYVEFYGKFFEGGGVKYVPFKEEKQYTKFED